MQRNKVCSTALLYLMWLLLVITVLMASAPVVIAAGGQLEVRRISPAGDEVEPGREIAIQFDRTMVALGDMRRDIADLDIHVEPDPGCEWRWLNTSELACRLAADTRLLPATQYAVTVGSALEAEDGSQLAQDFHHSFTTWLPQVKTTYFEQWDSPVSPVFRLELNVPVTAQALREHLVFQAVGKKISATVVPYNKKRKGPVLIAIPGRAGAVFVGGKLTPESPLDADQVADSPRRVWQVSPSQPLDEGQNYTLQLTSGLQTSLGALAGVDAQLQSKIQTFKAFAFDGLYCGHRANDGVRIRPVGANQVSIEARMGNQSTEALVTTDCRPENASLVFNAPVPRQTLAGIQWQPIPTKDAAELQRAWDNASDTGSSKPGYLSASRESYGNFLPFELKPAQDYELVIPADSKDSFGRRLGKEVRMQFRTAHRAPRLFSPRNRGVLETDEPTIMPLKLVNLNRLTMGYQQLDFRALNTGDVTTTPKQVELLNRAKLQGNKDEIIQGQLGIRELLDGQSGLVWGTLDWAPDGPTEPRQFSGQVTPWNVFAKVGYYDTLVWVTRLADGQPVANASVALFEVENEAYDTLKRRNNATVITDEQGLARLPGVEEFSRSWWDWEAPDIHIGVTRDNEMALLPLTWAYGRSIYTASHGEIYSDTVEQGDRMRAWGVTAQGIYKPGSDVQYAAFLRQEGETTLLPPPSNSATRYELTITNPDGDALIDAQEVELSDYGDVNGNIHIPETAPMGWYTIHLAWYDQERRRQREAGRFLVTDFVPAAFQVRTQVEEQSLHPGSLVNSHISAKLHAGGPYTAAKTVFKTRLIPRRFSPDNPAAAGFVFGLKDLPDSKTLAAHETLLDQHGEATNTLQLPKDTDLVFGELRVEGVVSSARGKSVSHSTSQPFSARDRFIGLRTNHWMQTAKESFTVDYIVTDEHGKLQSDQEVQLALEREEVHRVREKTAGGDYGNKEETEWVGEAMCEGMSTDAPEACSFTPQAPGHYRILASVTDSQGRQQKTVLTTYVAGEGTAVWSHEDNVVTLVPDQSEYHVGDTARVMVQNPYPGAQALVTVERYGVLWKKLIILQGSAPVIEVPIEQAAFPGAYLSVTLFSPRVSPVAVPDLGKPVIAQGYIPLRVTGKGSRLDVAVHPDKSEYRPGDSVTVDVDVTNHHNKPADKTRLLVTAVDQGVLDLLESGESYYDPRTSFYAPPDGPDMENYSLVEQLLSDLEAKEGKGESPSAGGGDAGPKLRDDFTHAAFWQADLETDANGQAQFEFTLPDNLTRWRIFVIALQADDAMGVGDASVRSNLPLQILPALPNQLRVGDSFSAGFEITNRSNHKLTATTRIQARDVQGEITADADNRFTLGTFDRALAWLPLTVAHTGQIQLQATVDADSQQLGHLQDGTIASLPVRHAGSEVTAATYGSLSSGSARVPVHMPDHALADAGAVKVIFSPTVLGGLDGAFITLRDSPYNNWEARLSRAVLASHYQPLKEIVAPAVRWDDSEQVIVNTLTQASDFQASNGGMAFWSPRSDFVSQYLSVYTALAFGWLDRDGYTLPDTVTEKLQGYLQKMLDREDEMSLDKTLKAGALAALALSSKGEVQDGEVANLVAQRHDLLLFGKALLMSAAVAVDDRESATTMMEALFSHAEESAGQLSFNEQRSDSYARLIDSPIRSNCTILSALIDYKRQWGDERFRDTPQKLMHWIVAQRNQAGYWPNSQENVFCVNAIRNYADEYEAPIEDLTGVLHWPGIEGELKAHFDARTAASEVLSGPDLTPGEAASLELGHEGNGRLYYNVRLDYVMPPNAVKAANAGMTVKRHYYVQRDSVWQPVTDKTALQRGDIVRIDLEVSTPTQRHHVVLTDPLPGAFEAVNRELATTEETLPAQENDGRTIVMFDGGAWPSSSITSGGFYHREMAHEAVRFHADALPAGDYRLVYSAQVVAPGKFTAPAPHVRQVYQPDVFGRGEPMQLQVQ